jgi:flagellar protein FlaF
MGYGAYAEIQKATETPRDLESRAISHITHQLKSANAPDANPLDRIRALNGNMRLWSLLIEDLSGENNALPEALRARYISLGLFAHRASQAALSSRVDLSGLIRINTDVLDALNQQRMANT